MIVYLDRYKAYKFDAIVDTKSLFNKHKGMPFHVSVEGTYVKCDELLNILCDIRQWRDVNKWIGELRNPPNVGNIMIYRWKRGGRRRKGNNNDC